MHFVNLCFSVTTIKLESIFVIRKCVQVELTIIRVDLVTNNELECRIKIMHFLENAALYL